MQDWPDTNSWIANSETLLTDLVRLSDRFDEVMMRGPSTPSTFDMEQVEMNWADFVASARRFSQRLRAAQTRVNFPVDANAIIRVADIVDDLNYGPQRWQTSTDEADREHTTMEFKELYFEPYVMCHHIFVDTISTIREYLGLNQRANPETLVPDARCSDDFRSVWWFGRNYSFSTNQAEVVKVLWKAWKNKTPEVSDITLLDESGGDAKKIRDVFKETGNTMNDAWGTMIQRGRRDTLKLAEPEIPEIPP